MSGDDYELLDSGDGRKLERFGKYVLARPCSQAMWRPSQPETAWRRADASFDREDGTHSSILAWRIPWTEEPGRLQSMGSQRVGHNLAPKPPLPPC